MKRTKAIILFVTFFIICIFISESFPGDKKAKTQTGVLKDNIEEQYIFTQWSINFKISTKYFQRKMATLQRMHNYNSREAQQELRNINDKISELENEKNRLKLDALKYYKGKLPKTFIKKWDKNEDELFSEILKCQHEESEIIKSVNE